MSSPTQAELITQLQNLTRLADEMRLYAETNAQNFVSNQDTLIQSLEGDHADQVAVAVQSSRGGLNSALVALAAAFIAHIRDWGRLINSPNEEGDFGLLFTDLYDYFIANALTIETRAITYNAPVAGGGNAGDGELKRLTVDRNGEPIENVTLESVSAKCTADQNSGTDKGKELFRVFGQPNGRDVVETRGSGFPSEINLTAQHSGFSLIQNPSFDTLVGSTISTPTEIPNWDIITGVIGDFELDETDIALPAPNDNVTVRSLRIKSNVKIVQKLVNIRRRLNVNLPYFLRLWYNKTPGAVTAGTLTIRMGSQSASVNLAVAGAGWQKLDLTIDQNLWFPNFDEEDLDIEIEVTGLTGTYLLVDDATFVPWSTHDGSWYLLLPGRTPFLFEDLFTWSNTGTATAGRIQRTLNFFFRRFLPSDATPSIADP